MIVTEKEAAEKWCPYGKFYPPGEHKYPGGGMQWGAVDMPSAQQRCIGSRCMAWKWHRTNVRWGDLSDGDREGRSPPERRTDLMPSWQTYGYCAAFGKVDP